MVSGPKGSVVLCLVSVGLLESCTQLGTPRAFLSETHASVRDTQGEKNIFVFLDGTQNSQDSQTNVWRLFDAIRQSNDPPAKPGAFSR
jgi:uncharacterized protein (DUF2235 family)